MARDLPPQRKQRLRIDAVRICRSGDARCALGGLRSARSLLRGSLRLRCTRELGVRRSLHVRVARGSVLLQPAALREAQCLGPVAAVWVLGVMWRDIIERRCATPARAQANRGRPCLEARLNGACEGRFEGAGRI